MTIYINETEKMCEATTLTAVLAELGIDTRGVAIAQGERIIPRTKWSEYQPTDGEHLTLIRATQGG